MADKKISAMSLLALADLVPSTDYLPIIDPSEAAAADRNKRILVSSLLGLKIQGKTANYTVVAADHGTVINVTANDVTIAFDPAATLGTAFWCWVINSATTATHETTLNPDGSETIDGVATMILRRGEGCIVLCDGTNFATLAGKKPRGYAENLAADATRPIASADGAIAIGDGDATASAADAFALINGTASGARSFAHWGTASGNNAIALGRDAGGSTANAGGTGAIALQGGNAAADNSFASGQYATAAIYGKNSRANGRFGSTAGSAQRGEYILRRETTNNTPTVLTADDTNPGTDDQIILPNDSTFTFCAYITARRTDADDESAAYKLEGVIDRNANAASTALVGSVTKTVIGEDTAGWDVDATADTTNGGLAITATGENAKTIRWVAVVTTVETTG